MFSPLSFEWTFLEANMLILKSEFSKELSYTAKGILYTIINSNGQKFFTSEYLMELSIDNYETVKAAINELLF